MKRIRWIALAVAVAALFAVSIPLLNNYEAAEEEEDLLSVPLPPRTEYVESLSRAGKLTGNGNGMQYYAAMLIRSELSLAELEAYYAAYRDDAWEYRVAPQTGQTIREIEHASVSFTATVGEGYYTVSSWGDSDFPFADLDLRAH